MATRPAALDPRAAGPLQAAPARARDIVGARLALAGEMAADALLAVAAAFAAAELVARAATGVVALLPSVAADIAAAMLTAAAENRVGVAPTGNANRPRQRRGQTAQHAPAGRAGRDEFREIVEARTIHGAPPNDCGDDGRRLSGDDKRHDNGTATITMEGY